MNIDKGSDTKLCLYIKREAAEELKKIDPSSWAKIDIESFIYILCKYFNLTSKYPNNSNTFKAYIKEYHLNSLLCHLTNTKGNCQGIITHSEDSGYMNR